MKYCFVVVLSFLFSGISAQEYPFPQNVTYPYGYMPATFSTEDYEEWYSGFMSGNFLQSCNGGVAPRTDNGTKVEAMGWAMILTAYMGDKENFDGLYAFYKSKIQSHGMMAWLTSCNGVSDGGSASDGDLDVAFSLCVAAWQWGDSYREEAIKVINTVEKLITQCGNGVSVLYPGFGGGSPYGGCNETDISYYTPAFFRVFAEFTDNDAWEKLADDTYIVLNNGANDQTGLVPDWQTWEGGRCSRNYSFAYDACRVPWRITLDYLWNGNEEAKKWCTTIAGWANEKGPANIGSTYNLDGSGGGGRAGMAFLGSHAVATMAHSQEAADAFGKQVAGTRYDNYWYNAYLGNMYMLTLSGNMWRPGLTGTKRYANGNNAWKNAITLQNHRNGELVLSGIEKGYNVSLVTLDGKQALHLISGDEKYTSIDITSLKKGCYVLSVRNREGIGLKGRIVSIF
jgi:endoglucanase